MKHLVTHALGSDHLLQLLSLLLLFFLQLVLCLGQNLPIKVLFLALLLRFKLCLLFDLLVKHVFDLLRFHFVFLFNFALSILVQFLPVSLDLAPLVIGYVRWKVVDLYLTRLNECLQLSCAKLFASRTAIIVEISVVRI